MVSCMGERGVLSLLADGHALASPGVRRSGVWVMGRSWYDRARAALCDESQEHARASAHALVLVRVGSDPSECPACKVPVGSGAELVRHVADMSDPLFREPSPLDRFLGHYVRVVEGDVPPRLVVSWMCSVCGVERLGVPCADCGACDGCCEAHAVVSRETGRGAASRFRRLVAALCVDPFCRVRGWCSSGSRVRR